jgi:hypothetical protein
MNVQTPDTSLKRFLGGKNGDPVIFFHIKKLPKVLRYQLNILKSTLDRGVACGKRIPALMKLWTTNMNGKNYYKRKEEFVPMSLPET